MVRGGPTGRLRGCALAVFVLALGVARGPSSGAAAPAERDPAPLPEAPAGKAPRGGSSPDPPWSLTLYGGYLVETSMVTVPIHLDRMNPSYRLVAVALARRLGTWGAPLAFEYETQLATYLHGSEHVEWNNLAVVRWRTFPWDRALDTGFAFGAGLSLASEVPRYEREHFRDYSAVLAYVLWEIELAHPRLDRWRLVARLHHRSGAYGTFHGVYAGSNVFCLGIKHTF